MSGLRVGFAGLGRMGAPMARNLLAAGFSLTVYNRTPEACAPLADRGAGVAATPAEAAAGAEVVVTMLADGAAAGAVLTGPDGVFAGADPGAVVCEMSTIGPAAARRLAALGSEHEVALLDAPVSGSVAAAEAAALTAICGGSAAAFERARPVLAAMTARQLHLGPSGAGAAMKLALNAVVAVTNQVLAEALVLAEAQGIPRERAYDALEASAVASPYLRYKRDAFLRPGDEPVAFTLRGMQKDVALALALGRDTGMPMLATTGADHGLALARGLVDDDADLARVADALREIAVAAHDRQEEIR